jgi:uncharacterized repeat protein (TIGR01451 family)
MTAHLTNFRKRITKAVMLFAFAAFVSNGTIQAQTTVVIPDANFAAWLTANIPAAMSGGNLMDTTHADVINRVRMDVENQGIADLTGIQYFVSLQTLDCGNGNLGSTPNTLTTLPALTNLNMLDSLICGYNQITSLPALPSSITYFKCYGNQLTSLPALPPNLQILDCASNLLSALPSLPNSITSLICDLNQLTNIPTLPTSLAYLSCTGNQLTALPSIPSTVYGLYCGANQLTALPTLPGGLFYLQCTNNLLTSLPLLPSGLYSLDCDQNQLTSLPALPAGIVRLDCNQNQLSSISSFPATLTSLNCSNNNIACFPTFPAITDTIYFHIGNNPFNCLPNYIPAMNSGILAYPLCAPGNSNGCAAAGGIVGFTFNDRNSNCLYDAGDSSLVNIPVKLFDSSNNLLGQISTAMNGVYHFTDTASGMYRVLVDTTGFAYETQCVHPGLDSIVTSTGLDTNINFSLQCRAGFDVGVQSAVTGGIVFPGQHHNLSVVAGDMTQWYNLNCAAGNSGTVQITLVGPATYVGPAAGALTPTVVGNVLTYTIADFGAINNNTAFNVILATDTTAQAGDLICAAIAVTPGVDNMPINNTYQYCYPVVNSHDPNVKEVYPVDVVPGYTGWLTYTIHFQNTGSAPAFNIRIADTLDANLDLTTFQLINYSHLNTTALSGNVLTVRFSSINLPDSTSNLAGSSGFVQYRIKPKANLTLGTSIHNTAYIYFDYNSAVVTNTTTNMFTATTSISNLTSQTNGVVVYPNPFDDNATFVIQSEKLNGAYSFDLVDVLGKKVQSQNGITAKQFQISRNGLGAGIYFYKVYDAQRTIGTGKIIIK